MANPQIRLHEAAETPSERVTANAEHVVTDKRGRQLTLRRPDVLAEFDLVEMLGARAENGTYVAMVLPLIYLSAIDGDRIRQPATHAELKALISRLDREGLKALGDGVREHFRDDGADEAEAKK